MATATAKPATGKLGIMVVGVWCSEHHFHDWRFDDSQGSWQASRFYDSIR